MKEAAILIFKRNMSFFTSVTNSFALRSDSFKLRCEVDMMSTCAVSATQAAEMRESHMFNVSMGNNNLVSKQQKETTKR
jgi:hypothetical protein